MAGVRKHALNLPGIDATQPDVFETPDLPAQESSPEVFVPQEGENESIDRGGVTAKKAFDKFSDKAFATSDKDYSESVGKRKGRGGLISGQREYSIVEDEKTLKEKEAETPLQRFHRLQFEVSQFIEETQALTKQQQQQKESQTQGLKSNNEDVDASEMTNQLVILQGQLTSLLSGDASRAAIDPAHYIRHHAALQTDLSRKLISEIQSATSTPTSTSTTSQPATSNPTSSTPPTTAGVTYELYYTPDQQKYVQLNKMVDLEKRLAGLEELVGTTSPAGTRGSAPATSAPLASLVGDLRDKVTLLDGPRLESLIQKIKALTPQLEAAKTGQERPAAQDKKINDMYEMMTKWDSVSATLPALVTRLLSLKSTHEDAAKLVSSIQSLDREQAAVHAVLRENAQLAGELDKSFKENTGIIERNVKALDERVAAIQQKMEKK